MHAIRPHLALPALLIAAGSVLATDSLRFEPAVLDLGELRTGRNAEHKVTLRNGGATPMEIVDLTGSCGCLRATIPQRLLDPGQQIEMGVSVHTLSAPAGEQAWHVKVCYFQDGKEHLATLPVRGLIVQEIVIQPPLLWVNSTGPTRHEIRVTDLRPAPFRLLRIEATSPHLRVGPVSEEKDAKGRRVRLFPLEIAASLPVGRSEEQLVLHTDDPIHRELRVNVGITRRARQRVEALPETVDVVASPGLPQPSRLVTLRDSQGEPVLVDRVEAGDPAIVCKAPHAANSVSAVRITINSSKMRDHTLRSEVTIHFKQPAGESVKIPVIAVRR